MMANMETNMITDSSITLYNKYIDANRAEQFQRFVVDDVVWWSSLSTPGGNKLIAANIFNIIIPFGVCEFYLDSVAWRALVDKSNNWTLQEGDFVVNGNVPDIIGSGVGQITISALKAKHNEIGQILTWNPMEQGSLSIQHFEITAK